MEKKILRLYTGLTSENKQQVIAAINEFLTQQECPADSLGLKQDSTIKKVSCDKDA